MTLVATLPHPALPAAQARLLRLEAVRGFAAAYVVAHHAVAHNLHLLGLPIGFLFRFGQEAVIVFFLLSGFVIHHSFAERPTSAGEYLFNRAARIFIPLVPVLLLSYGAAALAAHRPIDIDIRDLFGNLLMLQDISLIKPGVIVEPYMGNLPLWSLSYEWWFYLAYIVLVKRFGTEAARGRIVLATGILCAGTYYWHPDWALRVGFYLTIWWCGVSLAQCYRQSGGQPIALRPYLGAAAPLLGVTIVLVCGAVLSGALAEARYLGRYPVLEIRHFGVAVVFVALACFCQQRRLRWLALPLSAFALIAPISYALYISHVPILKLATALGANLRDPAELALAIVIVAVFCSGLELVFYPRARKWLRRLLLERPVPGAPLQGQMPG